MSTPDPKAAAVARAQFGDLGPNAPMGSGQEMNLNLILEVMVSPRSVLGRLLTMKWLVWMGKSCAICRLY